MDTVAGGVEQVIEAGAELVAASVVECEAATYPAAQLQELGRAESLEEPRIAGQDDAQELTRIELPGG